MQMRTTLSILIFVIVNLNLYSQTTIKGIVTDSKGTPLAGANAYIKGTYDGYSANENGEFKFQTKASGSHLLVVSFIGYIDQEIEVNLNGLSIDISVKLKEKSSQINGVVITAGTFETADRKRSVTLQPLDIVTTPSAEGDIYGALVTLPGTAIVGEDGRLFVRGGDAYESKTFIDGLLSKKPYGSNVPDLPSRGRFSPFLFSGTTFSTGGYSAEYGQALSSALILTTNSFPQKSQTEISIMSIGGGITQTLKKKNTSLAVGLEYMNLEPYYSIVPQRFSMNKYPESIGLTAIARHNLTKTGILKIFSTYSTNRFGLKYPDISDQNEMVNLSLKNGNSFTNISFSDNISNWILKTGVAITLDNNNINLSNYRVDEKNSNIQAKLTLKRNFNPNLSLLFGFEETSNRFSQNYSEKVSLFENKSSFGDYNSGMFVESEIRIKDRLAIRAGVRGEHSSLLADYNLASRLSTAFLITSKSQISVAYGNFYQTPSEDLLRFTKTLEFEQADHYIANYQWESNNRILRFEAYRKDYRKLVVFNSIEFWDGNQYNNTGSGKSKGIDIFFRDQKTFKSVDYWISYSYVDSKRLYRDFPKMATPHFAPKHSASFVAKKWVQSITTQFGLSASVASGRPYNNPNSTEFMDGRTPLYNDISINCSHLRDILGQSSIIYLSVSNVLGRENIFGYRYFQNPNSTGIYESFPIKASSKRFYFIGIFISI
jgi:hypothetical protein